MPQTAAVVDEWRAVFGRELIDQALRRGYFLAVETGADGITHRAQRGDAQGPAMVVTRRAWGYRA